MISQKATLLCVYEVLKKYSDEAHIMSVDMICSRLKSLYDIDMERRTVYRNIDALRSMGIEIEGFSDNHKGYYLVDREFEPFEIRLLCDAVAASNMIKPETGKAIIGKLIDSQSIYQKRMMQKTVYVKSEQKILNKQILYNIDILNEAINQGCMVTAKQMKYDLSRGMSECEEAPLIFSAYATVWVEGNYFVIVKRKDEELLSHLRIDFLKDIQILEDGVEMIFGGLNPTQYAEKYILHDGETMSRFDFRCDKCLWDELVETFGDNVVLISDEWKRIKVKVKSTPKRMKTWILANAESCEVLAPVSFRDEIKQSIMEAYKRYW